MKKILLGLALGGLVLTASVNATKANAAENFEYIQNFDYVENYDLKTNYHINSGSNSGTHVTTDGYLVHTFPQGTGTVNAQALEFKNGSRTLNQASTDNVVLKMRFKTSDTYTKSIQMYVTTGYGSVEGSNTFNLLQMNPGYLQTNISGSTYKVDATAENFIKYTKDTWYEMVTVIEQHEGAGSDIIHTYLNGVHIYTQNVKSNIDLTGAVYALKFQRDKTNNPTDSECTFDYIHIGKYNGGSASIQESYSTTIGETFTLEPTVTATDSNYDLSVPNYKVKIDDDTKLTFNKETNKFEALASGTATVTYDFADALIADVTSTVTIEEAQEPILVDEINLSTLFNNDEIILVKGESFNLNDLFTVTPATADDKILNFVHPTTNDVYSVTDTTITATNVGEVNLVVNSNDGNATKTIKVKVVNGYLADLPEVGTNFAEIGVNYPADSNLVYQSAGYTGSTKRTYSPISVVNDPMFGKTFKYEGVGGSNGGGSYINHWIYADQLTANKNYKLTVFAKIDGVVVGSPRVDLKIVGFTTDAENNPIYDTTNFQATTQCTYLGEGWYKFETADFVNFDATRLEGLKMELVSFNNSTGIDTYISHARLVEVEGDIPLKGVEVSVGDVNLANKEVDAPIITLNQVGASLQVTVLPIPSAATATAIYTSSNEGVATVDATGKIVAVANGTTLITVTTEKGSYYLTIVVEIEKEITEITVEDANISISEDETAFNIPITINPEDYTSEVIITIGTEGIVDNVTILNGKLYIKPVAPGTTTITLTSADNEEVSLVLNVTVTEVEEENPEKPCTDLTIDKTNIILTVGNTTKVNVTLNPTDTTDELTFESSNTSIVTVDENGNITAVAAGTTTIKVKCGNVEKTINVTVNAADSGQPENPTEGEPKSNLGLIIGATIGGIVAAGALAGLAFYLVKKNRK